MVKMKNRKAWLRIVEAFIAVLIVIGALLIVLSGKKAQQEQEFCSILPPMMEKIAKDEILRSEILLKGNETTINKIKRFLEGELKNPAFAFSVRICEPTDPCVLQEGGLENIDICAEQRIISTTKEQTSFSPKKLKVFMFRI